MTVEVFYDPTRLLGDGAVKTFAYTFITPTTGDLKATLLLDADSTTVANWVEGVDYTVAIDSSGIGGILTVDSGTAAPLATEAVFMELDLADTQVTDIPNVGGIQEEKIEVPLDRRTLVSQLKSFEGGTRIGLSTAVSSGVPTFNFDLDTIIPGRALIWAADGLSITNSDSDFSDLDAALAAAAASAAAALVSETAAAASAAAALVSENAAAASETAAAASAAAAVAGGNDVSYSCTSQTQVVIASGSVFVGVDSSTVFTFTTNRTFTITGTAGTLGSLNTGSEANSTHYFLIALGDTTSAVTPHIIGVTAANYVSFTTADLTGNYSDYDDFKRIGTIHNSAVGDLNQGEYLDGVFFLHNADDSGTIPAVSTSSSSHVDAVMAVIPTVVRLANIKFHVTTSASAFWRSKLTSKEGAQILSGATGQIESLVVLDSSQTFQFKTSAGVLHATAVSYFDDLSVEGQ